MASSSPAAGGGSLMKGRDAHRLASPDMLKLDVVYNELLGSHDNYATLRCIWRGEVVCFRLG